MNKVHVRTGDEVIVINGKDRGKKGKVLEVSPSEGKVIVETSRDSCSKCPFRALSAVR